MSVLEGSNWFEKLTVAGEPSSTGPLLARSAVGATFVTETLSVYSETPPSLSRILPLTARVPSSFVVQVAVFEEPKAP